MAEPFPLFIEVRQRLAYYRRAVQDSAAQSSVPSADRALEPVLSYILSPPGQTRSADSTSSKAERRDHRPHSFIGDVRRCVSLNLMSIVSKKIPITGSSSSSSSRSRSRTRKSSKKKRSKHGGTGGGTGSSNSSASSFPSSTMIIDSDLCNRATISYRALFSEACQLFALLHSQIRRLRATLDPSAISEIAEDMRNFHKYRNYLFCDALSITLLGLCHLMGILISDEYCPRSDLGPLRPSIFDPAKHAQNGGLPTSDHHSAGSSAWASSRIPRWLLPSHPKVSSSDFQWSLLREFVELTTLDQSSTLVLRDIMNESLKVSLLSMLRLSHVCRCLAPFFAVSAWIGHETSDQDCFVTEVICDFIGKCNTDSMFESSEQPISLLDKSRSLDICVHYPRADMSAGIGSLSSSSLRSRKSTKTGRSKESKSPVVSELGLKVAQFDPYSLLGSFDSVFRHLIEISVCSHGNDWRAWLDFLCLFPLLKSEKITLRVEGLKLCSMLCELSHSAHIRTMREHQNWEENQSKKRPSSAIVKRTADGRGERVRSTSHHHREQVEPMIDRTMCNFVSSVLKKNEVFNLIFSLHQLNSQMIALNECENLVKFMFEHECDSSTPMDLITPMLSVCMDPSVHSTTVSELFDLYIKLVSHMNESQLSHFVSSSLSNLPLPPPFVIEEFISSMPMSGVDIATGDREMKRISFVGRLAEELFRLHSSSLHLDGMVMKSKLTSAKRMKELYLNMVFRIIQGLFGFGLSCLPPSETVREVLMQSKDIRRAPLMVRPMSTVECESLELIKRLMRSHPSALLPLLNELMTKLLSTVDCVSKLMSGDGRTLIHPYFDGLDYVLNTVLDRLYDFLTELFHCYGVTTSVSSSADDHHSSSYSSKKSKESFLKVFDKVDVFAFNTLRSSFTGILMNAIPMVDDLDSVDRFEQRLNLLFDVCCNINQSRITVRYLHNLLYKLSEPGIALRNPEVANEYRRRVWEWMFRCMEYVRCHPKAAAGYSEMTSPDGRQTYRLIFGETLNDVSELLGFCIFPPKSRLENPQFHSLSDMSLENARIWFYFFCIWGHLSNHFTVEWDRGSQASSQMSLISYQMPRIVAVNQREPMIQFHHSRKEWARYIELRMMFSLCENESVLQFANSCVHQLYCKGGIPISFPLMRYLLNNILCDTKVQPQDAPVKREFEVRGNNGRLTVKHRRRMRFQRSIRFFMQQTMGFDSLKYSFEQRRRRSGLLTHQEQASNHSVMKKSDRRKVFIRFRDFCDRRSKEQKFLVPFAVKDSDTVFGIWERFIKIVRQREFTRIERQEPWMQTLMKDSAISHLPSMIPRNFYELPLVLILKDLRPTLEGKPYVLPSAMWKMISFGSATNFSDDKEVYLDLEKRFQKDSFDPFSKFFTAHYHLDLLVGMLNDTWLSEEVFRACEGICDLIDCRRQHFESHSGYSSLCRDCLRWHRFVNDTMFILRSCMPCKSTMEACRGYSIPKGTEWKQLFDERQYGLCAVAFHLETLRDRVRGIGPMQKIREQESLNFGLVRDLIQSGVAGFIISRWVRGYFNYHNFVPESSVISRMLVSLELHCVLCELFGGSLVIYRKAVPRSQSATDGVPLSHKVLIQDYLIDRGPKAIGTLYEVAEQCVIMMNRTLVFVLYYDEVDRLGIYHDYLMPMIDRDWHIEELLVRCFRGSVQMLATIIDVLTEQFVFENSRLQMENLVLFEEKLERHINPVWNHLFNQSSLKTDHCQDLFGFLFRGNRVRFRQCIKESLKQLQSLFPNKTKEIAALVRGPLLSVMDTTVVKFRAYEDVSIYHVICDYFEYVLEFVEDVTMDDDSDDNDNGSKKDPLQRILDICLDMLIQFCRKDIHELQDSVKIERCFSRVMTLIRRLLCLVKSVTVSQLRTIYNRAFNEGSHSTIYSSELPRKQRQELFNLYLLCLEMRINEEQQQRLKIEEDASHSSDIASTVLSNEIKRLTQKLGVRPSRNIIRWQGNNNHGIAEHAGLMNLGATCYMNSIVQNVRMNPLLHRTVMSIPLSIDLSEMRIPDHITTKKSDEYIDLCRSFINNNSVLYNFQKLLTQLHYSKQEAVSPHLMIRLLRNPAGSLVNFREHCDCAEMWEALWCQLETSLTPEVLDILQTRCLKTLKCLRCGTPRHRTEPCFIISLTTQDCSTLNDALDKFVEAEQLSDVNCDICGTKQNTLGEHRIKEAPPVLLFSLGRFRFDLSTLEMRKFNDRIEFPIELDLSPYLSDEYNHNSDKHDNQYELTGIIVHKGKTNRGHYYTFIKDQSKKGQSQSQSQWYRFDDSRVTLFDLSELEEECFGGTEMKIVKDDDTFACSKSGGSTSSWKSGSKQRNTKQIQVEKDRSAYILLYQRKDIITFNDWMKDDNDGTVIIESSVLSDERTSRDSSELFGSGSGSGSSDKKFSVDENEEEKCDERDTKSERSDNNDEDSSDDSLSDGDEVKRDVDEVDQGYSPSPPVMREVDMPSLDEQKVITVDECKSEEHKSEAVMHAIPLIDEKIASGMLQELKQQVRKQSELLEDYQRLCNEECLSTMTRLALLIDAETAERLLQNSIKVSHSVAQSVGVSGTGPLGLTKPQRNSLGPLLTNKRAKKKTSLITRDRATAEQWRVVCLLFVMNFVIKLSMRGIRDDAERSSVSSSRAGAFYSSHRSVDEVHLQEWFAYLKYWWNLDSDPIHRVMDDTSMLSESITTDGSISGSIASSSVLSSSVSSESKKKKTNSIDKYLTKHSFQNRFVAPWLNEYLVQPSPHLSYSLSAKSSPIKGKSSHISSSKGSSKSISDRWSSVLQSISNFFVECLTHLSNTSEAIQLICKLIDSMQVNDLHCGYHIRGWDVADIIGLGLNSVLELPTFSHHWYEFMDHSVDKVLLKLQPESLCSSSVASAIDELIPLVNVLITLIQKDNSIIQSYLLDPSEQPPIPLRDWSFHLNGHRVLGCLHKCLSLMVRLISVYQLRQTDSPGVISGHMNITSEFIRSLVSRSVLYYNSDESDTSHPTTVILQVSILSTLNQCAKLKGLLRFDNAEENSQMIPMDTAAKLSVTGSSRLSMWKSDVCDCVLTRLRYLDFYHMYVPMRCLITVLIEEENEECMSIEGASLSESSKFAEVIQMLCQVITDNQKWWYLTQFSLICLAQLCLPRSSSSSSPSSSSSSSSSSTPVRKLVAPAPKKSELIQIDHKIKESVRVKHQPSQEREMSARMIVVQNLTFMSSMQVYCASVPDSRSVSSTPGIDLWRISLPTLSSESGRRGGGKNSYHRHHSAKSKKKSASVQSVIRREFEEMLQRDFDDLAAMVGKDFSLSKLWSTVFDF